VAFYVYILASQRNGTLYTGYTDELFRRVTEHKAHALPGFTSKYAVTLLVWFEEHESRESAFAHERRIKKWRRAWKLELIERLNPSWRDLFSDFTD
jgi:putative endonuclease